MHKHELLIEPFGPATDFAVFWLSTPKMNDTVFFVLKPVAMHYSKSVSHHGNTGYLALLKASEGMGVWAYDVGLTA